MKLTNLGIEHTHRIKKLMPQYFSDKDAPHQHHPDVMHSTIKARQTRYLVPVCEKLCRDYCDNTIYSRRRLYCLQNLSKLYDIVDQNGIFLTDKAAKAFGEATSRFLLHYSALAKHAMDEGKYQWSIVPKFHFMEHIAEDAVFLSPKAFWCYSGESFVGTITSLAQSCLAGLPPHRVSETVCIKYRIGKHIQYKSCYG